MGALKIWTKEMKRARIQGIKIIVEVISILQDLRENVRSTGCMAFQSRGGLEMTVLAFPSE